MRRRRDRRRALRAPRRAGRRRRRLRPTATRARRSRCGAARRWPTSPTSRSPASRSAGSTSCGCARPSSRSTPISPRAATQEALGRARAADRRAPAARAPARAAHAGAVSLRPPGRGARRLRRRRARRLVDEIGVEPGAELRELHERDPAPGRRELRPAPGAPAGPAGGGRLRRRRSSAARRSPGGAPVGGSSLAAAIALLAGGAVFAFTRLDRARCGCRGSPAARSG